MQWYLRSPRLSMRGLGWTALGPRYALGPCTSGGHGRELDRFVKVTVALSKQMQGTVMYSVIQYEAWKKVSLRQSPVSGGYRPTKTIAAAHCGRLAQSASFGVARQSLPMKSAISRNLLQVSSPAALIRHTWKSLWASVGGYSSKSAEGHDVLG